MPLFNAARYVSGALDSLLAQSETDFELFISDNASTDNTGDICRAYATKDARIRYTRLAENIGAVANFNRVFFETSAPYFVWAAYDDVWHPDFLKMSAAALDANPGASMANCGIKFIDEAGAPVEFGVRHQNISTVGAAHSDALRDLLGLAGWYAIYGVMRRSVAAETQLFEKITGADVTLTLALLLRGEIVKIPEALFSYRVFAQKSAADQAALLQHKGGYSYVPMLLEMLKVIDNAAHLPSSERQTLRRTLFRAVRSDKTWYRRLRTEILPYIQARQPQWPLVARELLPLKIYPLRKILCG